MSINFGNFSELEFNENMNEIWTLSKIASNYDKIQN